MILLRALPLPPPKSDLDDEQKRDMLASPQYLQEREASADQPRVYHSYTENSVSISSCFRASAGRPAAVFSRKRKSSQEENKPGFMKNWRNENEHFEKLILKVFMKWKN